MKRPSGVTAASTGAPLSVPWWPLMRNAAASTESWMVFTSFRVFASYTVIVWRYIMFCAKT